MGGGETAAEGGRIITMVRRFWGPTPTQKDLGTSPLNSLNLTVDKLNKSKLTGKRKRKQDGAAVG